MWISQSLAPEDNFANAEKLIREAADQGASLAVLPEYHLTGWAPEDPEFASIAATAQDYLARYCSLAQELRINLVPGTIVVTGNQTRENVKPPLYNVASFIDDNGIVCGKYLKTNLWHPEREHLTSGPSSRHELEIDTPHHSVFQTPLGPVGLLVCYDLFFPEGFRALVRQGARIIIVPTFTKADDLSTEGLALNRDAEGLFIRAALTTRAFENTCCIVFCNAGGPKSDGFVGLSQIAMPIMGTLAGSFDNSEAGMKIVQVDMTVVDVAERNYKIRQDLAEAGFHYPG